MKGEEEKQHYRIPDLCSGIPLSEDCDGHAFSLQPGKLVVKYINDEASSVLRKGVQGHFFEY